MSLGATAISISGGDRPTLRAGFHSVSNCTIHDYAKVHWCYHPGVEIEGVGHTVTHNEIYSAPHQGILVNGNDHRIAFNVFHDLLLFLDLCPLLSRSADHVWSGASQHVLA